MRTYRQWLDYQELELISAQEPKLKRKHRIVLSILKDIRNFLLSAFKGSQLQLWQTVDSDGNIYWNGYDPQTNQSIQLATEEELRVWVDESVFRRQTHTDFNPMLYSCPYLSSRLYRLNTSFRRS